MAASKPVVVVKGDPVTSTLGDCPFCHRVLLTLATKGIPFDMEYVDFANKPQWLLDVSGGKVPVIKVPSDNNLVMPDSDNIVVYLEEKHPDPSMKSDAPAGIFAKVFPAFRAFLTASPEEQPAKRDELLAELKPSNDFLAASTKGPLFGGKAMDATDAAFAPRLYHVTVMLYAKGFELPLELSGLWRYMGYIQTLPAWQQVDYGAKKIMEGWSKHH